MIYKIEKIIEKTIDKSNKKITNIKYDIDESEDLIYHLSSLILIGLGIFSCIIAIFGVIITLSSEGFSPDVIYIIFAGMAGCVLMIAGMVQYSMRWETIYSSNDLNDVKEKIQAVKEGYEIVAND